MFYNATVITLKVQFILHNKGCQVSGRRYMCGKEYYPHSHRLLYYSVVFMAPYNSKCYSARCVQKLPMTGMTNL